MTNEIKLIAVDLDGTLLDSKHELSPRTEAALKAAIDKGVQVVLATGKTRASAQPIIDRLGLKSPGIFLQGLAVYESDGTLRYQQTLDAALVRQVITFAEDRGFVVVAYAGGRILMRADNAVSETLTAYGEPMPEAIGPIQNIADDMPLNKLVLFGDPKRIKALRWQLSMQLNGSATLTQAQVPSMVEVLPPGASKGTTLKRLLKDMGIAPENVLALGDGENDIAMLEVAGIGVAVGNADEKLKAAADHVVATNDAGGVAEAIVRFVLGGKPVAEPADKPSTNSSTDSNGA